LQQKFQRCDELASRLSRAVEQRCGNARIALDQLLLKLVTHSPKQQIARQRDALDHRAVALRSAVDRRIFALGARLQENMHALHIASPMATRGRGYSITLSELQVAPVTRIGELSVGQRIGTRLSDGTVTSLVEKTRNLD